jgi:hypothetical protein
MWPTVNLSTPRVELHVRDTTKLSKEDALWNAKTLKSIEQSIKTDSWVNL